MVSSSSSSVKVAALEVGDKVVHRVEAAALSAAEQPHRLGEGERVDRESALLIGRRRGPWSSTRHVRTSPPPSSPSHQPPPLLRSRCRRRIGHLSPPGRRACSTLERTRREEKRKRKKTEKCGTHTIVSLTCGPHINFIFFLARMSRQQNHLYILPRDLE